MGRYGFFLRLQLNQLARLFYKMQGYNVEEGYDFFKAKHPQEKMMLEMAKLSLKYWEK